jgi:hypothetical protein
MKAIVTIRLNKTVIYKPKERGRCPIGAKVCTDVNGDHHCYIESGKTLGEIESKAMKKYGNVTRIETVEEEEL